MINKDRIVPIQKMDLLSMFMSVANIMFLVGTDEVFEDGGLYRIEPDDIEGKFTATENGIFLATQPVKRLDITSDSNANIGILFVTADDFTGIYVNGEPVSTELTNVAENIKSGNAELYYFHDYHGSISITDMSSVGADE